jgi:glycosyltransferase involved in cell wall biosynthesis
LRTLRVAIIADGMPNGGTERQIIELLKGIKLRCSHITTIFGVLVKGGVREKEAVRWADEVLPIRQENQFDISLAWSMITFVKAFRIDIVHSFGSIADLAGLAAAKMMGVTFINGSIRSARSKLTKRDWLSKFTMRFADMIVANSHAGLKAFSVNRYPNVSVIHNGIDLNRFDNIEPFIYSRPTVCMVGNFSAKKDHSCMIRAFSLIHKRLPNSKLILVGKGSKKILGSCRGLTSSLNLLEHVDFITNTDHPEFYVAGCHVGVLISPQGEGISNVIMEYMALGKPVVATDKGGNSEIVEHGRTGYLIPKNTPKTIADVILKLLQNPDRAQQMGKLGRDRIKKYFNIERMIDEYELLYYRLLTNN